MIKLLDVSNARNEMTMLTLEGHSSDGEIGVSFSPDGTKIVSDFERF